MDYNDCIQQYGDTNADYCAQFPEHTPDAFDVIGGAFGFFFGNILWVVLGIFVIILIAKAFHIIREKETGVVERLGRFNRIIQPGFRVTIPFFERIVERIDLELRDTKVMSVIKTKEDQVIELPVVVTYKVIQADAQKALYEVENPKRVITALVGNEVKAKAATMTLQEIYDDRDSIKDVTLEKLRETVASYGFELTNVVIDDPVLSKEMRKALNNVSIAEKKKQAATAEGEALRIQEVAEAEAEGTSLKIKADAYVVVRDKIAKGNAQAVKELVGDTGLPPAAALAFLAGIDRNDAIRAASENGATVVIGTNGNDGATLGMLADITSR